MVVDLIIKNCRIVMPYETLDAGMAVDKGKIVSIARDDHLPASDKVIDAKGRYLLPGAIDAHVHFRDPGYTEKEDFRTGSEAAAAGGVTTVLDMPNNIPLITDPELVKNKIKIAEGKSLVDFGLFGCATKGHLRAITGMAEAGVIGFKIFMGQTTGVTPIDDGTILKAFKLIAETKLRVGVHAENEEIRAILEEELKAKGKRDLSGHMESRPRFIEEEAISRAILLSRVAGNKLHICHTSTSEGVELICSAKAAGQPVTAETGPQYLLFKEEHIKKYGFLIKANPPVRGIPADREALWRGLRDVGIDMVASDHAPHPLEDKIEKENFWEAGSGMIGVETMMPLMLTQVNTGMLSIHQLITLTSETPARYFNLFPKKGVVQVGSDADLVLIDIKSEGIIRRDKLHSKSLNTAFDGWKVIGMPTMTIVRGTIVYEDGEIVGRPGHGELQRPIVHS
ncbi:MAG: allantoinase AllB [Nitrososphaeria archaeon]|nr:allantoinase AllB [Nitrososphaeria archaeon]NIN52424.1 allantoinase AllB [Nitrososphaeria archaeon]NIQ32925.1 allantoinase AllB [Nitrososphaeria archaeon]